MTDEEAITHIKSLGITNKNSTMYKALDLAIKALEQTELNSSYNGVKTELKPCEDCIEDCISREDAIKVVRKWFDKIQLNGDICLDGIRSLPSVTPQQRVGKWILRNSFLMPYKCSECNYESERYYNYCPNCGLKMEGEE